MQNTNVPFDFRSPVALPSDGKTIPTIVGMVRNSAGQLILVLPRSTAENASALQFPQGPIGHMETPLEALEKLLKLECGLHPQDIEGDQVLSVYKTIHKTDQGKVKDYHFVLAHLRRGSHPKFTEEVRLRTRSIVFVNGPYHLWEKMKDCSPAKQRMLAEVINTAVLESLLPSDKMWTEHNIAPVLQFAGRRHRV